MKQYILHSLFILCFCPLFGQKTEKIYLSGTGYGHTVTWDFYCSGGSNSGKWSKIEVPSQWELQGFGEYTYGRWYIKKGNQPSKETGIYRHSFLVSESWRNKRILITFDGVMIDAEVTINGKKAGEKHQGAFYRFSYDISNKVLFGKENLLEVKVAKHSENESVNSAERKADWWIFGGIYRPVYLEATPKTAITHVTIDARADGSLKGTLDLNNPGKGYSIDVSVTPLTGEGSFATRTFELSDNRQQQSISTSWENIIPWNPENPQLYVITIKLKNARKQLIHEWTSRVGFR
ncbi:MAG TPA: beta-galactosidase, partial [Bacteroidales bacterium]|nr:beta-galactosidase [Bacteroidales bacterium]